MKKRYWLWVATLSFLAAVLCSSGLLVARAQEEPPIIWPPTS